MSNYKKSAVYYDAIYEAQGKDYGGESSEIHQIVQKYKKTEGNNLLDVAIGTGAHYLYLSKWYNIDGLDISDDMLEIVRKKFPKGNFMQGNMLNFSLDRKFDVITCLFSSIGYMLTIEEMRQAIKNMASHLKEGGVLIVEPWITLENWKDGHASSVFVDKPDLKIARMNISESEGSIALVDFHFLIAESGNIEYFTELHKLALFSHQQYLDAFKDVGLKTEYDSKALKGRGRYIGIA